IGFVFQSYNLIPHQTVLANVELALTLSGIDKQTRKERAAKALERVGLGDQLKKLPAQLSGGQAQRVAIARAIVNDPDIILADEPTGALDTETSVQVMDILKELAKDKLVIMVTHNPDLAVAYSSRIINLRDGLVKDDSAPFLTIQTEKKEAEDQKPQKQKKPSMSFLTALSLSLKNLATKKARTVLTSFAGSIGIIGIALILSLSSGFSAYINKVQRDTLSNYPIEIKNSSVDINEFAASFLEASANTDGLTAYPDGDSILTNKVIGNIINTIPQMKFSKNDLSSFKKYIVDHPDLFNKEKISAISYSYNFSFDLYQKEDSSTYKRVNYIGPKEHYFPQNMDATLNAIFSMAYEPFKEMMNTGNVWGELVGDNELLESQYDKLAGDWPKQGTLEKDEPYPLIIVVDQYNRLPDYALYMMGLLSDQEVQYIMTQMAVTAKINGAKENENKTEKEKQDLINKELAEIFPDFNSNYAKPISFDSIVGKEFNVILDSQYYERSEKPDPNYNFGEYYTFTNTNTKDDVYYVNESSQKHIYNQLEKHSAKVKVVGVMRLKEGVAGGFLSSNIYYTPAFEEYLVNTIKNVEVVSEQLKYFNDENYFIADTDGSRQVYSTIKLKDINTQWFNTKIDSKTIDTIKDTLQITDQENPTSISIYPTSFENKDYVFKLIDDYNKAQASEDDKIKYSDMLGMMMSSITDIIDAITYVLIAFVSISLVVSSIMIGVITYISVLERTKEIGVLRAMGASKRDIARVFNAETIIIGFISGMLGITITILLNIPISLIIEALAGIPGVAALPISGAIALVTISVALTLIAGIIPSGMASKKDPVIALRSE
ncbi:MAG: ABC transporter ATP-binding protein/permease, partial [Clostridia bacterium]|nr:ABC transporter ATP-binding protein/permease [Clostridia bacterium]